MFFLDNKIVGSDYTCWSSHVFWHFLHSKVLFWMLLDKSICFQKELPRKNGHELLF